jgi:hypothetical protein
VSWAWLKLRPYFRSAEAERSGEGSVLLRFHKIAQSQRR